MPYHFLLFENLTFHLEEEEYLISSFKSYIVLLEAIVVLLKADWGRVGQQTEVWCQTSHYAVHIEYHT